MKEAQGSQSHKAADVLAIIQHSIENGTIKDKYLNNSSLSELSNYLLYGADVKDKELLSIGKKLWQQYSGAKAVENLKDHYKATEHQKVDDVGGRNH